MFFINPGDFGRLLKKLKRPFQGHDRLRIELLKGAVVIEATGPQAMAIAAGLVCLMLVWAARFYGLW